MRTVPVPARLISSVTLVVALLAALVPGWGPSARAPRAAAGDPFLTLTIAGAPNLVAGQSYSWSVTGGFPDRNGTSGVIFINGYTTADCSGTGTLVSGESSVENNVAEGTLTHTAVFQSYRPAQGNFPSTPTNCVPVTTVAPASPSPIVIESPSPIVTESSSPIVIESPSPVVTQSPSAIVTESPSPVITQPSGVRPPRSPRPGAPVASAPVASVPAASNMTQRPARSARPLSSAATVASAGVVASDTVRASASAQVVASASAGAASAQSMASASAGVVASDAAASPSLAAVASASARTANRAPAFVPEDERRDLGGPGQRTVDIGEFVTDPDGDVLTFVLVGGDCPSITPGLFVENEGTYTMDIPVGVNSCDFSFGASDGVNPPVYATLYFINTEYNQT